MDIGLPTSVKRNKERVPIPSQGYTRKYSDSSAPSSSAAAQRPTKRATLLPPLSHEPHVVEEGLGTLLEADEEHRSVDESPPSSPGAAPSSATSPFDSIRDGLEDSFIKNFTANVRSQSELAVAEHQHLQQQADSVQCACPTCGCDGPHNASGAFGATVLLGTLLGLHKIQLKPLRCSNEDCSTTFLKRPTELACIPGSANGFTLKRTSDQTPLWFHLSLLSFVDSSMYHAKATSVYSVVQTLEGQWLQLLRDEELLANMDGIQEQAAAAAAAAAAGEHGLEEAAEPAYQAPKLPVTTDTLNRNLGCALQEYRYLLARCQKRVEEVPAWPLAQHQPCSACIPGRTHVHYDMCFTLRCLRGGNKYTLEYRAPDNRRLFVDNSRVQERIGEIDEQQQQQQPPGQPGGSSSSSHAGASSEAASSSGGGSRAASKGRGGSGSTKQEEEPEGDLPGECAHFQADKLIATDSKKYLITGAGITVCRHGHVLMMVNAWTGERHAYAILCLHLLVLMYHLRILFWWYDINCRWMASFLKWREQLPEGDKEKFAAMQFPIPPFHLYAHREQCRTSHGHLHMLGAGRGTGEKAEHVNAVIGPHGSVTKYMSPTNREAFLEHVAWRYMRSLDCQMSSLLVHMVLVTQGELETCLHEHAEALGILRGACQDCTDVEAKARELVEQCERDLLRRQASGDSDLGWQGRYVKARLLLERMKAVDGADLPLAPPISLVFASSKTLSKVKITQTALRTAAATVRALSKEHLGADPAHVEPPDISHPEMQAGVNQWLAHEFKRGREQLATTVSHIRYADSLVQRLRNKPEKKAVLERKAALTKKAAGLMTHLTEWACWAGALAKGPDPVVKEWDPQLSAEISAFAQATLDKLSKSGSAFPWLPLPDAGGAADVAAHKVYLLECLSARLREELQLLKAEQQQLVVNLQGRLQALGAAVAEAPPGPGKGRSFLLLQEWMRCKQMLARARQEFSSLEGEGVAPEVAAAAFVAVGCGGGVAEEAMNAGAAEEEEAISS